MFFTLLAFIAALGILITFHELGHYSVARLCGVRVLRFSVGFGRVLLRRVDRHGTEWAVSALPLGGYVKMQDDPPPGATPAQINASFNRKPVGQRFAIVAAGPVFNLVLAVALYASLNLVGTEEPAAVIASPAAGTPAAQAGFNSGDRIVAIDGAPVASWSDARWELLEKSGDGGVAEVTVERSGGGQSVRELRLPAHDQEGEGADPMALAGLALSLPNPTVRGLVEGSAGARDGMQAGDVVVAVGAIRRPDTRTLIETVKQYPGMPLPITVRRGDQTVALTVTPSVERVDGVDIGRIGAQLGGDIERVTVRYGLIDSLGKAATRTWETAWFSLKMMGRMLTGDVSWKNISGPVTIADYAGQSARIGAAAYVAYLALISISLGVLNLLPIPMLDGGHLLYYLIEIVRGRPLSERWLEFGQRVGLALLALLMGLAFFNDLTRVFG